MALLQSPNLEQLPDFLAALKAGWSPDNTRPDAGEALYQSISRDPESYFALCDDINGAGPPVNLPDGTLVDRLPGLKRWIWSDGFCGAVGLRWQAGTTKLPSTCLGHIGYAVVPWRRREGLATAALIELTAIARKVGLAHVDLAVAPENLASQRVIENAGGHFINRLPKPAAYDGKESWLYRIDISHTQM